MIGSGARWIGAPWWGLALLLMALSASAQEPSAAAKADFAAAFEECQSIESGDLRGEVRQLAQRTLQQELAEVNYLALVERHWQQLALGQLIDQLVERAVATAKEDKSYLDRLASMYSQEQAEALANYVVTRVYQAPEFKARFEALAEALSADLAERLEAASERSSSAAMMCLRSFIAASFGTVIEEAFTLKITPALQSDELLAAPTAGVGIGQFKGTIAAATLVILRKTTARIAARVTARLTGRIAARLAGRVVTKFIPFVGWGLVGYDLWVGKDGILPSLADELTSRESKSELQQAIAEDLRRSLPQETRAVAVQIADSISQRWGEFRRQFRTVLELTERNVHFAGFVATIPASEFAKLADLVATLLGFGGEEEVVAALDRGHLDRAMAMPQQAFGLITAYGAIQPALAWYERVGQGAVRVLEWGIYRHRGPDELSAEEYQTLLTMEEPVVAELVLLELDPLRSLLTLPASTLQRLVERVGMQHLGAVAWYLDNLDQRGQNALVVKLLEAPSAAAALSSPSVRRAIAGSSDASRALAFITAPVSAVDLFGLYGDLIAIVQGEVPLALVWQKYRWGVLLLAALLLLPLLMLLLVWRWLFGGRRQVVVVTAANGKEKP